MKKSLKKNVNYLKRYIGCEVIRTKPAYGDKSYMTRPIIITGFTPEGYIKYVHFGEDLVIFGEEEYILPVSFTDRNWVTLKKALKRKNNPLNKWIGKEVLYRDESYTLISASKSHIVVDKWIFSGLIFSVYDAPVECWRLAE